MSTNAAAEQIRGACEQLRSCLRDSDKVPLRFEAGWWEYNRRREKLSYHIDALENIANQIQGGNRG